MSTDHLHLYRTLSDKFSVPMDQFVLLPPDCTVDEVASRVLELFRPRVIEVIKSTIRTSHLADFSTSARLMSDLKFGNYD
jgi:hypothetical protein